MKTKYPIIEKAWVLNNSNLDEPWFCDDCIVYYGTRGQAKKRAISDNDMAKLCNGEDINFLYVFNRESFITESDLEQYEIENTKNQEQQEVAELVDDHVF